METAGLAGEERRGREHFSYITELRAVSCIAVVMLHTALAAAGSFEISDVERMWTMLLRNLVLWAVPCFIMVTGALLLDPGRSLGYGKLFSRYVKRVLLCILLFTAVFEIFDLILNRQAPGWWVVPEYLMKVISGKSWSHMWYLYMLLGLYLLMPFCRMMAADIQRKDMLYLIAVLFLFLSVLPMLREIFDSEIAFFSCVSAVYPLYLFLGYFIHSGQLRIPGAVLWGVFFLSTAGLIAATAAAYLLPSALLKELLGSYSFPLTLLQSVCVFALFARREMSDSFSSGQLRTASLPIGQEPAKSHDCGQRVEKRGNGLLELIDRDSFGIYLIHMMFLKGIFVGLKFNPYRCGGVLVLIPLAAGVLLASMAVVRILKCIWGVRSLM